MSTTILSTNKAASDGDSSRGPKTNDFTRNDEHWLLKLGEIWARHQNLPMHGTTYRLDELPAGFMGYEKRRGAGGGDSKHVDRYIYGHPNGVARSIPDFKDHFLYLMDHGSAVGCTCKLCSGQAKTRGVGKGKGGAAQARTDSVEVRSRHFPAPNPLAGVPQPGYHTAPQHYQVRKKQVDEEGTPDALRMLIDKLKSEGPEGEVDESLAENLSPDWRVGHVAQIRALKKAAKMPVYIPREGEVVLFVRDMGPAWQQALGWDGSAQTWRLVDPHRNTWLGKPQWEAGVITQLPRGSITEADLHAIPQGQQLGITDAGFRIEPLPQPNSANKHYSKQHKYIPLHAIRPLAMWQICLGAGGADCLPTAYPTINHALTVASSFCVQGKFHFKGTWPEASIFAQGIFMGSELICVGDAVRLQDRGISPEVVKDVLVITAIKIRIVNLDEASDDDYDDGHPYNTCTHVSGKAYTLDPACSYHGVGKLPVSASDLPSALAGLGTWYHLVDPARPKMRIEVPFTRVLGKVYEQVAIKEWFTAPSHLPPPSTGFQAVNQPRLQVSSRDLPSAAALSYGAPGVIEARKYSQVHDIRIARDEGKSWFWADTRVEQLDLHEANGHNVGAKNAARSRDAISEWRRALETLDAKSVGGPAYPSLNRQQAMDMAVKERSASSGPAPSGTLVGPPPPGADEEMDATAEEVSNDSGANLAVGTQRMDIDDDDEEEEEEEEAGNVGDALAVFKAKAAQRAAAAADSMCAGGVDTIELDSD